MYVYKEMSRDYVQFCATLTSCLYVPSKDFRAKPSCLTSGAHVDALSFTVVCISPDKAWPLHLGLESSASPVRPEPLAKLHFNFVLEDGNSKL
jgi:hypothetical protein